MKQLCTTFIAIFLITLHVFAQQYDAAKVNKKAAKLYQDAMQQAEDGKFKEGILTLENAVKIDDQFLDAYLSIAGMYGELKKYDPAILNYEKAKAIDSLYFKDYNLPYSINLAGKGEFEKALHAINTFLTIDGLNESSKKAAEYRRRCYLFAIDYAANNPNANYKFEPTNLGDSINSAVSEYYPTITIDDKQLIYTRRVGNMNEDFFETDRTNNNWSKSRSLSANINTNLNEERRIFRRMGNG